MPETNRPLRVFLCHASVDKPAVRKLHRFLRQRRMVPWLDEVDILPGENWEVEIPKAIFTSDVILVCLSKNSVDKEGYVQKEITFALDKALEKPEGTIFIIPAKLEECSVPAKLSRYQWVDLYRDGYKRLMLSLNKRAAQLGLAVAQAAVSDTMEREKTKPEKIEHGSIAKPDHEMTGQASSGRVERDTAKESRGKIVSTPEMEMAAPLTPRKKAEDKARKEKEAQDRKAVEDRARKESEEQARKEKEERDRKAAIERAHKIFEEEAKKDKEEQERREEVERDTSLDAIEESSMALDNLISIKKSSSTNAALRRLRYIILLAIISLFVGFATKALIDFQPKTIQVSSTRSLTPYATQPFPLATNTPRPPTITPRPTLGVGSTLVSPKDKMLMVYVPAGKFEMGSDNGDSDERPIHTVYLDSFWIDQTNVTNAMYALCVKGGKCNKPSATSSNTHQSYYEYSEFGNYPVIYVTWNDAEAYCSWVDRRLPTEAEWEKTASWDDDKQEQRVYPWGGSTDCSLANYWDKGGYCIGDTTKVGSYKSSKSFYGALDMAGNVWEWVSSLYKPYPYNATDGREDLTISGDRVLRGGSWYDNGYSARSANRNWSGPQFSYYYIGFRCARSP